MSGKMRNRIRGHRKVRAGDLVPHELNYRVHPAGQRSALEGLYKEIGFARSLLAYELPDGRLKLIDGHLRRELDVDQEVDVEVLDVTDDEARKLLLSLDPLAALAGADDEVHRQLCSLVDTKEEALAALWRTGESGGFNSPEELNLAGGPSLPEQYLVIVTCRDEAQQIELLERLLGEGLDCKALL